MFGAPKLGRFRSLASLILVVNVVGELQRKRTLAASRGFLAAARLSCVELYCCMYWKASDAAAVKRTIKGAMNRRKSTALNITNTMDAIKERQV